MSKVVTKKRPYGGKKPLLLQAMQENPQSSLSELVAKFPGISRSYADKIRAEFVRQASLQQHVQAATKRLALPARRTSRGQVRTVSQRLALIAAEVAELQKLLA